MENEMNKDKYNIQNMDNTDDIEKSAKEQAEDKDIEGKEISDDMLEVENNQQDDNVENEVEENVVEIPEDEGIENINEMENEQDNSQDEQQQGEEDEDCEQPQDEEEQEEDFDYMSYMSIPRYFNDQDDTKEDMEQPQDDLENNENYSNFQSNNIGKTVFISTLISIISSIVICGIFVAILMFAWPYIKQFNKGNEQPAFKTYKNITIESTSNELIAEVAEKVGPSVVGIKATVLTRDYFFGITEANPEGSGIVFRENGYILTNNHVIESALSNNTNNIASGCKIEVILPSPSNKTYEAKVIGRDTKTDLAVLKIEETGLQTAEFGNSDNIRVGEVAIAIGNPGGLEYMGSVTSGIISGLNRTLDLGNGKELKLVQTDAAINPGNSGGALVNSKGEVIGVNTVKIAGSNYEGLGFAIPSNTVKEVVESLVEFNYVKGRPLLGIKVDTRYTENIAKQYKMPTGVYVASVDLLSAADQAGIEKGDVITEFDGIKIKDINELNEQKNKHTAGDEVQVKVYKTLTGKTKTLKMKLGEDIGTIS